jgi:phage antirepressor YoqD-like protein
MNELISINKPITSMQIAEITGKQHAHIMRDIRDEAEKLKIGGISYESKFGLVEYTDAKGEKRPCYQLSKEGVLQLAARYDAVIRAKLIELAMRQDKPQLPQSFAEALRLAADLEEQRQKLLPKAQGYDYLMNASGAVTIGEAAKIIDIKGIGPNKFFKLLVAEEIIFKRGNSYLPYSEYKEHFIVKQNPISIGGTLKERSQLYLSMADLDWLAKFLTKRGYQVNYTAQKCLA